MSKSPQTENGYTRIANELLEVKTRTRISGEENQIWEVIIRQTYGYNKKRDVIALSQFTSKTGMNKSAVCRAIKKLLDKNMIIKKDNANSVTYGIQKDYSSWKPLSKKITIVVKKDNDNLVTLDTQKGYDKSNPLSKKIMSSSSIIKKDNSVIKKDNAVVKKDNNRCQKRDTQKTKDNIQKTIYKRQAIQTAENKITFAFIIKNPVFMQNLQQTYIGVDLKTEFRKMQLWLIANPTRDKKNYERFVINWLNKIKLPSSDGLTPTQRANLQRIAEFGEEEDE